MTTWEYVYVVVEVNATKCHSFFFHITTAQPSFYCNLMLLLNTMWAHRSVRYGLCGAAVVYLLPENGEKNDTKLDQKFWCSILFSKVSLAIGLRGLSKYDN